MNALLNLLYMTLAILLITGCSQVADEENSCSEFEPVTFEVVVTNEWDYETNFEIWNIETIENDDAMACYNVTNARFKDDSRSFEIESGRTIQKVAEAAGRNGSVEIRSEVGHGADQEEIVTLVTDGERLEFTIGADKNLYLGSGGGTSGSGSGLGSAVFYLPTGILVPEHCHCDEYEVTLGNYPVEYMSKSYNRDEVRCGDSGTATFENIPAEKYSYKVNCKGNVCEAGDILIKEDECKKWDINPK